MSQSAHKVAIVSDSASDIPPQLAKELGITPSSLHRRLKAEGTFFLRCLDDTRRCLTQRYLMESSLKLTDIAARVGYSELSAFSRAARRWWPSAASGAASCMRAASS